MKQAVAIAAVLFVATAASATNFRAADQVYLPTVGFVAGAQSTFISDVFVSNVSTDAVDVSVLYVPRNAVFDPNNSTTFFSNFRFTLQPGERREFRNFVQQMALPAGMLGVGHAIFNACRATADCTDIDDNGFDEDFRNITVQSRTYAIPGGTTLEQNPPTTGQSIVGVPWYNYVSQRASTRQLDRVFITGLRETGNPGEAGTYRTNLALVNATQFGSTTLVLRLYQGQNQNPLGTATVNLGPLQISAPSLRSLFPTSFAVGAGATNLYLTIEQTNSTAIGGAPTSCLPDGCAGFLAFASVLDNRSEDSTTMEAQYTQPLTDTALSAIYGATGTGAPVIRRSVGRRP